jgi:hypothetical protein
MVIWRRNAGRRTRLRLRSGGTVMGIAMEDLEAEVVKPQPQVWRFSFLPLSRILPELV